MARLVTTSMLVEENKRDGRYPMKRGQISSLIRDNLKNPDFVERCIRRRGRIYLVNPDALNEFLNEQRA